MNRDEILAAIKSLALTQGFYGRLLRDIHKTPKILVELEKQHFTDTLDMILWLEC